MNKENKTHAAWCLCSPKGKLINFTVSYDRKSCWLNSVTYLKKYPWMKDYYDNWAPNKLTNLDKAEKRGWNLVKVKLTKLK
jgi:hypothetical protein